MRSMVIDRRTFVAGLLAAGILPVQARASGHTAFVAALRDAEGYAVAGIDARGVITFTERLPARGHGVLIARARNLAIVLARRPDRFGIAVDLDTGKTVASFEAPPGHHFYGHGFVLPGDRYFVATENDFEAERGVCGIYDMADGYRRVGAFETGGIGPHEAILLDDQLTVVAANGGIATHPDYPRMKLNLPTMQPALAYIDFVSGRVEEVVRPPEHLRMLSIRHAAQSGDGAVWWCGQYEGPAGDRVPLVGVHRRGEPLTTVDAPDEIYRNMNHYTGAVAADPGGRLIAVTSPRGGTLTLFDANTREVAGQRRLPDVCAVTVGGSGFVATTGAGWFGTARKGLAVTTPGIAWDNHIAAA